MRQFVWRKANGHGIPLVAWETVTKPKRHGGLGIRSARMTNVALLGKNSWNLVQQHENFWVRVVENRYLVGSPMLSHEGHSGSYFWQSILKAKPVLKDGFSVRFGNENSSFWYDKGLLWVPFVIGFRLWIFMTQLLL